MDAETGVITGPMVAVTWAVAAGWAVLGVATGLVLAAPANWVFAALGLVGAVVTGWLALGLRVRHTPDGLRLAGRGTLAWPDIEGIEIVPGFLSVPTVVMSRGRALESIPLEGLAWFGGAQGAVRRLAERVADHAGVDVRVRSDGGPGARRAA